VVSERDRLGLLEMCVRSHDRVAGILGLVDKHSCKVLDLLDPMIDSASQIEPKIEGDLIVTGTPGVETSGVITDQFSETAFDGGVDVLVGISELETPGVRLVENVFESVPDPSHGFHLEQADLAKHVDVGE